MNMAWSRDLYKMYNNALLKIVLQSGQGVDLGNGIVISGVGQADDVGLLSNDIHCLHNILHLAMNYCQQYHLDLCADKTKLLLIKKASSTIIHYNPITLNGQQIPCKTSRTCWCDQIT